MPFIRRYKVRRYRSAYIVNENGYVLAQKCAEFNSNELNTKHHKMCKRG